MKTIRLSALGAFAYSVVAASSFTVAQQNAPPPAGGGPGVAAAQGAAAVQGARDGAARAQAIGSTAPQAARAGERFTGNPRFDRTVLGRNGQNGNGQNNGQQDGQGSQDGQGGDSTGSGVDPGFVGGGGGGSGITTTAYGAARTAEADVIRSQGEFNRNTAAAQVLHEDARGKNIDNRYSAVSNYFEVREANREMRSRERGLRPTEESVIRYNQSRIPQRLSAADLDRQIGEIHWPAVLMQPQFEEHRARLATLFYERGYHNSGLASANYVQVKAEAALMSATLESLVYDVDPQAYLHAKKFITGPSYEARFVATAGDLIRS